MKKFLRMALMCAVFVSPFVAHAEDTYLKLGVGQSGYDLRDTGNTHQTGYFLAGGMAIDKNVDVEIGYIDFGKGTFSSEVTNTDVKVKSFYIAGIGKYWVNDAFNVYGKLGIAHLKSEANINSKLVSEPTQTETETETKVLYGVGASYHFTKELSGSLEYAKYRSNVDMFSAGVRYSF